MKYSHPFVLVVLASSISYCAPSMVQAQDEAPHSDVEFEYIDGAIVVEAGEEGFVFEGEFGEGAFSNQASEPGIASEVEEGAGVMPNDVIAYNVLDNLYYWNGSEFVSPGSTTITIAGVGGAADTVVGSESGLQLSSFTVPANLLGQADDEGDLHVDPKFTISDGASAGGYGLLFSLSTDADGIADSNPFGVFLNLGMEEEAFEAGVEAFGAIVPEPNVGWQWSLASLGLFAIRRRRSRANF